jgi:2-phosphosulfolactate phosphatase
MAESVYNTSKDDIFGVMTQASHFKRLANYGLEKDIRYCLAPDGANVLPIFRNGELVVAG